MKEQLRKSTENMHTRVAEMKQIFVRTSEEKPDFYKDVKPYVDKLQAEADEWRTLGLQWIKETRPQYVHPLNIEDAHENIMNLALQAFFHDVKEKRFMEMAEAITYTLSGVQSEM
ncbi:YppE family protein [Bacillus tianshenii]|nr:YppE family protein [Bacillus tianshenii]